MSDDILFATVDGNYIFRVLRHAHELITFQSTDLFSLLRVL